MLRHFALDRRFPARERTFVHRRVIGKGGVRNFSDDFAVFEYAHLRIGGDPADFHRIQSPLLEDAEDFLFAAFLRDQQHALLRLAEHNLVRSHAGFALRDAVEFDFDSGAATRAHLAGRARQPGGAHILNADDHARLHGFEAGFEQQFLEEWISDLDIGPLRFRSFAELLARHGGAVDTIASGLGAHINYGIALARCASVKNLVAADQAESERVHQRIAGVAGLELHFATEVGYAEAVTVRSDATDHAFHDGMILVDLRLCGSVAMPRSDGAKPRPHMLFLHTNRPKPQRVHHRDRPCAHGENVAQNSADASGRALKWLDKRRVIVRLDFERAGPSVANIDDASVFTRPLDDQLAARGQALQVNARRLIGTMLAPHHAENAEFGPRGLASAEQLLDFFEFFRSEAVLPDHLRCNGSDRRGGHRGIFIVASPPTFRMWIRPNGRRRVTIAAFFAYASVHNGQSCSWINCGSLRRTKLGKQRDACRRRNRRRQLRAAHDLQRPIRLFSRRVRLHYLWKSSGVGLRGSATPVADSDPDFPGDVRRFAAQHPPVACRFRLGSHPADGRDHPRVGRQAICGRAQRADDPDRPHLFVVRQPAHQQLLPRSIALDGLRVLRDPRRKT